MVLLQKDKITNMMMSKNNTIFMLIVSQLEMTKISDYIKKKKKNRLIFMTRVKGSKLLSASDLIQISLAFLSKKIKITKSFFYIFFNSRPKYILRDKI